MTKPKFNDELLLNREILDISSQITRENGSPSSRHRWEAMFNRLVMVNDGDESLATVDVYRVFHLMDAGWHLAMIDKDHPMAYRRLGIVFNHPDIDQINADRIVKTYLLLYWVETLLSEGKTSEAIEGFRCVLNRNWHGRDRRMCLQMLLDRSGNYLERRYSLDDVALPEFIDLLNDVLRQFRGTERPRRMLAPGSTYRQLNDFIVTRFFHRPTL
jgi:hypothetical protein